MKYIDIIAELPDHEPSSMALEIMKKRHFQEGEDYSLMCSRVSKAVGNTYDDQNTFYEMMRKGLFLPSSPYLANAGLSNNNMSCFVIPVEDSIEGIGEAVTNCMKIQAAYGGVGLDFSSLRSAGSSVESMPRGGASGPLSFMELFNTSAKNIYQGGSRSGALMAVLRVDHPDIREFIHCKDEDGVLSSFNISVAITDEFMGAVYRDGFFSLNYGMELDDKCDFIKARELWDEICTHSHKTGEPGVIFIDEINLHNPNLKSLGAIEATNPCVSGDTLVAVADGRDCVSIKELAEIGEDVLVHCADPSTRESLVRMGRNPRKTRENEEVFRVLLDDGTHIDVTADHNFLTTDGKKVKTKDLVAGTSLFNFSKYEEVNTTKGKTYWTIINKSDPKNNNSHYRCTKEHRLIKEFHHPKPEGSWEVHHKDDNSLNNDINNLQWINPSEHKKLENALRDGLRGENNPMFGKRHSDASKELMRQSNIKFMSDPARRKNLSLKHKEKWKDGEYRKSMVEKFNRRVEKLKYRCGTCKLELELSKKKHDYRSSKNKSGEVFCCISCVNSYKYSMLSDEELVNIGLDCLTITGKISQRTWNGSYKEFNNARPDVKVFINRFGSWKQYTELVRKSYNHKVISVTSIGSQDVYNITVDEFHTVAYITNPNNKTDKTDMNKMSGIVTFQCGEASLRSYEACNLGSIVVSKMLTENNTIDVDLLKNTVHNAVRFLDSAYDINEYPLARIKEESLKTRKIGLGIMGFADLLMLKGVEYGSYESENIADQLMEIINTEAHLASSDLHGTCEFLDDKSLPCKNSTLTSIAPNGTIGLIAGVNGGIEPVFALAYKRMVNNSDGTKDTHLVVCSAFEANFKNWDFGDRTYEEFLNAVIGNQGRLSYEICGNFNVPKVYSTIFITAGEVKPENHVGMLAAFQKHVDMGVSKTINLPNDATVKDVQDAYELAYELNCKGLTVYRDGCRSEQVLSVDKKPEEFIVLTEGSSVVITEPISGEWSYKQKEERPRVIDGKTWLIRTDKGKYYLTINGESNIPLEVFASPHSNDVEGNTDAEGLCRMVSLALRSRIPLEAITDQLSKVKYQSLLSLPINVKKCLEEFHRSSNGGSVTLSYTGLVTCPECKEETLVLEGGCSSCMSCGFSSCG